MTKPALNLTSRRMQGSREKGRGWGRERNQSTKTIIHGRTKRRKGEMFLIIKKGKRGEGREG